jgi:ferrous iron transport protein A
MNAHIDSFAVALDSVPLRVPCRITGFDWSLLSERDGRRLRELGVDEGVIVEKLHMGPFGRDPIACRIGRMTVALRSAQAAALLVEPLPQP